MWLHYLKIAWRNLLKYRMQSVVSILGLAVGLACFALSAFWIHYEMTYDTFHRDADRLYLVGVNDDSFGGASASFTPYALGRYLKEHYSEIEDYCLFEAETFFVLKDNRMLELPMLLPDTTALRMLDIRALEGDESFLRAGTTDNRIAITEKAAKQLFGTTDVIGQTVTNANWNKEYTIGAVVSDWGVHTNFPYAFLGNGSGRTGWDDYTYRTLVKVKPGTDVSRLLEKMNAHFPEELTKSRYQENTGLTRFYLEPLTGLRATEGFILKNNQTVQFRYITWFAAVGGLIIVCAFINYLTIYIDRFRTRRREMVLRQVCGAGLRSLVTLLCTDFLLTVLAALVVGMVLVELLMPIFLRYSLIQDADYSNYRSILFYILSVSVVMMAIVVLWVWLFQKRSLHGNMHTGNALSGIAWRKGSVILQLTVCMAFIFCTVAMQLQLHHLRNVDTGMDYRGRAAVSIWMNVDMNVWAEKIKALPMVTEVIRPAYWPLLGEGAYSSYLIDGYTGMEGRLEQPLTFDEVLVGEEFFRFYDMQLLSGEWVSAKSEYCQVNIMESTARRMGWNPEEAVGKQLFFVNREQEPMTVIGVVKDCAYKSPTAELPNTVFVNTDQMKWMHARCFVLFKYRPGTWDECRRRIEEMQRAELPDRKLFLYSEEERYNDYLKSEDALSSLLGFSSLVCIFISIFGIYSLVTLACERRRKEIAIRKVNGATVGNILMLFFREYALLLVVSSLIAFPAAWWVMSRWIEHYNRQVEIGFLPFLLIFVGVALCVTACIGHRIWKTANENPAEVIKSE